MRCRTWKLAGLLLAAACVPGRGGASAAPGPAPEPSSATRAARALAEIASLERRAMLSVYFHARYADGDWLPAGYRPMPLEEAVGVLLRDGDPFAESRRRRAIARLYAAPARPERRRALERLGAPWAALEHRLGARETQAEAPARAAAGSAGAVAEIALVLEQALGPSIPDCDRTHPKTDVSFDRKSWKSTAIGSLTVRRGIDEMRAVLDPQNWDVCGRRYFEASYVALPTGGDFPIDAEKNAVADPNPPAAGSAWSGVLFEHFVVNLGPFQFGSFRTLLDVDSKPGPGVYRVDYSLRKSVASRVGPVRVDGGFDVDAGFAMASAGDAGSTDVEAKKVLRFANWGAFDFALNFLVGLFLEVISDEAYEGVCCEVPG